MGNSGSCHSYGCSLTHRTHPDIVLVKVSSLKTTALHGSSSRSFRHIPWRLRISAFWHSGGRAWFVGVFGQMLMSGSTHQVSRFPSGILNCNGMISGIQMSVEANLCTFSPRLQLFPLFELSIIIYFAASKPVVFFHFAIFKTASFM